MSATPVTHLFSRSNPKGMWSKLTVLQKGKSTTILLVNSCFDLYPLVEMTHIEIGCNNLSLLGSSYPMTSVKITHYYWLC